MSLVQRFHSCAKESHLKVVEKILRHLTKTSDLVLRRLFYLEYMVMLIMLAIKLMSDLSLMEN